MNRIFIVIILLCSSCAGSIYNFPKHNWQAASDSENIELQKLSFKQSGIEELRFLITVRSKRKEERVSFRQAVVLTKPSQLKIETYPTNAAYLLNKFEANGQTFSFQDFQNNTSERGKVTPEVFAEFFSIPLGINELLAILTGKIADEWLAEDSKAGVLKYFDGTREHFANNSQTMHFQLDPTGHPAGNSTGRKLIQFSKYSSFAGRLIFTGSYSKWQEFKGKTLPQLIELSLPRYDMEISIKVKPLSLG